ncbi:neuronal acetylcholine receptor subunit alpha-3-like [Ptychodera flava]|uniref:neuronal acetylcholine receptor subunit alpha-3-like n=1 Tax=Ptychodera flava TaxID=63121 RepID=UPI00396AAE9A
MLSQLSCSPDVVLLFTIIHCGICASDLSPFSRLSRDLLKDYDTDLLPVKNATDVLALGFVVCLHRIDDMDEKQQMITLTAYLNQRWQDKFLTWNPDDYDGITEIRFPADKIWRPDTAVLNSAQNCDGLIKSDTNVVIAHTGHVLWTVPVFLQSSCKFNIRYVPFDTQVCKIHFSSWSYGSKQLEFVNTSVHLDHYQEHGEWVLLSAEIDASSFECMISHNPFEMSGAIMTLALKRRPYFDILFIVVPFILISCLSLFVFLIPVESGEKMSLGITNLLTLIMFYTGASSTLPSTADGGFPLIGTFFFIAICLVLTSCLLTVLVLNIYHRKSPVPKLVRRLFFGRFGLHRFVWYFPEKDCKKYLRGESCGSNLAKRSILLSYPSLPSSLNSTPTMQRKYGVSDNSTQALSDLQSSLRQTLLGIERVERRLKSKEDSDGLEYTCNSWQKIAIIMDQLFFITLTTVCVSVTIGLFTLMSCNQAHSEFL